MLVIMQPFDFSYETYSQRLHIPSLGLALVLLIALATPTSSCTGHEKTSLLQFLEGLSQDGGLATSWRNGTDCCKWKGITCQQDRMVTDVLLASKGLEGRISPCLGNLTRLLRLNLSNNLLSGGLPQELVSSGSIIVIDVSFNHLYGNLHELSPSISSRPLKVLNISSNLFTGQFPSSTWKVMENLITLNASNNSFSGQLPTHFCTSSPSFTVLELSHNQFNGSIPPEIGSCLKLRILKVGHNNFTGTLPDELLKANLLECLDLGENNIRGKIPLSIDHLQRLEKHNLNSNHMSGELPLTLSNCTSLITIDIRNNNFSGELGKVNFSRLLNLQIIDLGWNNFTGTIPEIIYSCSNVIALRLSYNNFHGQLSEIIGNLKSLSFLSLVNTTLTNITSALQILASSRNLTTLLIGNNFMNETMPDDDSIDGFENLQVLAITDCLLLGKMPRWLSKLSNLEMLFLQNNQLTGPIPDWIGRLNFLFYLDISKNNMTGEIPTALLEMPMLRSDNTAAQLATRFFKLPIYSGPSLQYRVPTGYRKLLDLSNNKLTGEIPVEIGQLKALNLLNFSFNNLTGHIPQSICKLTNLLVLDLSSNNLTGEIPAELDSLHFLSAFNVSNNDLEGPIPAGGQFNTFQNSSFDGNTKLCVSMLSHKCDSKEAPLATIVSKEEKTVFVIAFSAFFGVGVLYDQIVYQGFLASPTSIYISVMKVSFRFGHSSGLASCHVKSNSLGGIEFSVPNCRSGYIQIYKYKKFRGDE